MSLVATLVLACLPVQAARLPSDLEFLAGFHPKVSIIRKPVGDTLDPQASLESLRAQIAEAKAERSSQLHIYMPDSPVIKALDAKIRALESDFESVSSVEGRPHLRFVQIVYRLDFKERPQAVVAAMRRKLVGKARPDGAFVLLSGSQGKIRTSGLTRGVACEIEVVE
ncbi:MAG TPA: hypothetical protein VMI31_13980, partial [Fimbriimonadaceae bacterium]|nr:hypothetical protein [Fimbriimonadaceae bacterium]